MAQDMQELLEATAKVYDTLKDQSPTYNEAGDKATYMAVPPLGKEGDLKPVTFVKINGLWYVQDWGWASKE
jgi:hypothetical protein